MKVFITGIAGFLGSHLADVLIEEGHVVSGCDNLLGGELSNVPDDAEFHKLDCKHTDVMRGLLEDIDIVYHTACMAYEGLGVFSPAIICQNTFQITASIASAAISNDVKKFVYCSSMSRYGDQKVPFTEDMKPLPRDPYAIAKVAGEDLIKNLYDAHGMEYSIAVPHNIIGPRQKYNDPFRNVAAIMINLMLQGRQPYIYGDGEQKRCFSFVDDCTFCLLKMGYIKNEIINIGPDEEFITINTLAKVIADIIGFKLDPIYVPKRPMEIELSTCSSDKARKLLGYKTTTSLRDGLESMITYIKNKGPKVFDYHLNIEIKSERTPETWTKRLF